MLNFDTFFVNDGFNDCVIVRGQEVADALTRDTQVFRNRDTMDLRDIPHIYILLNTNTNILINMDLQLEGSTVQ